MKKKTTKRKAAKKIELTTNQKIIAVHGMPEVRTSAKLLYALFKDCQLNSFIRMGFTIEDETFELVFQKKFNVNHK